MKKKRPLSHITISSFIISLKADDYKTIHGGDSTTASNQNGCYTQPTKVWFNPSGICPAAEVVAVEKFEQVENN